MSEQSLITTSIIDESTLKDIEEITELTVIDENVLEQIREVLFKHNAEERFGVVLLHKHFNVASNERLVERFDHEKRILTAQVEPAHKNENEIFASMWRFDVR